jgi:hypothetical protein
MAVHQKYKELVSGDEVKTEVKDEIREDEQWEDFEPAEMDLLVV